MPLSKQDLEESLFELFSEPPTDSAELAKMWADAIGNYSKDIVPLVLAPTIEAAMGVLELALLPALDNTLDPVTKLPLTPILARPALLDAAIITFVAVILVGMGTSAFIATPPTESFFLSAFDPIPLPLPPLPPSTPEESANIISENIHSWFKTGKATPSSGGDTADWT